MTRTHRSRPSAPVARKPELRRSAKGPGMGLVAVLFAWAVQAILQWVGFFDKYDHADADNYAASAPLPKQFSDHITIVVVNTPDYRTLFHSRSPLDSATLLNL